MPSPPTFVAYVYPGWHRSRYRPTVDEWQLLDKFAPYFNGHLAPPRPKDGECYDDSEAQTALAQIELAKSFGIDAFTYFLYYQPNELILSAPLYTAFSLGSKVSPFSIGLTWCLRLPHAQFPIPARASLRDAPLFRGGRPVLRNTSSGGRSAISRKDEVSLADLRLSSLQRLVGDEVLDHISAYDLIRLARKT